MLGASGMRIDVGWTYTTGRPDVKIAIIDCGIEWDDSDLVNKAYLNAGELAKHQARRTPTAARAAAPARSPATTATATASSASRTTRTTRASRPKSTDPTDVCYPGANPNATPLPATIGDMNKNCILDAGDLIELFSDGVDDDANGYIDDISGWDFYKNDNDPYDDTRYGHGTGEASDSPTRATTASATSACAPTAAS